MSHTKCVESFRGGVGWSFCEGSRLIPWMTPDKSLIVVEAVSSGITCPNLLIRFSARCGWTVVKLLVSLPIWSASLLFIDTTQTPLKFQNFQISYKRQGKKEESDWICEVLSSRIIHHVSRTLSRHYAAWWRRWCAAPSRYQSLWRCSGFNQFKVLTEMNDAAE